MSPTCVGLAAAIGTGLLWGGIGVVTSSVTRRGMSFPGYMASSFILTMVGAWLLFPRWSASGGDGPPRVALLAGLLLSGGMLSALGMVVLNRAMAHGHHGACWTIGQSALVIPFLFGLAIWADTATVANVLGVMAVLISLVLLGMSRTLGKPPTRAGTASDRGWFGLALLTLMIFGAQQTLVSIPSRWADWSDRYALRAPLALTGMGLGYLLMALAGGYRVRLELLPAHWVVPCLSLPSYLLLFRALDSFSVQGRAGLVFPIAVGTSIVTFALYSALVLRERLTPWSAGGLLIGITGVLLVAWR